MPEPPPASPKKNNWVQIETIIQLGIILPASTFIGWLLGAVLDRWLHTTWIYLAGLILGSIAGFIQLIRTATSAQSKE